MDRADIGFAALYTWYHEYNFLDLSMPVVRTGITCIAPAPRLLPSWLLPLNPFTLTMWLAVIATIFIGTLSIYFTGRYNDKNIITWTESFLASFGYMLSQPSTFTDLLCRPIIIQLLLLSVVLINAYSSGLSSAVTVPEYESSIDTVQNLVDAKISWGATHDAWIFSILAATEPNVIRLVKVFEKLPDKELRKKSKERMFAFSVERLPAGHYAIGDYVTEDAIPYLQLMIEDIYWEQCVIMTRKSSPFTKKLNKMIGRLHSAGLLLAWETQVVLKHSNSKVQLGVKLSRSQHLQREAIQLNIRHFQGVYILWIIGIVIATMVFLIEIYLERKM